MIPVVTSCSVEAIEAFVAERAIRSAKETYGAPFADSSRSFAFAARDGADGPQTGALLMTISGGVAALDELVLEPAARDGVATSALLHRFETTASYHNCHKACARVKRGGSTEEHLMRAGFRTAAVLERHYFQQDFVELVKWLQ